MGNLKKKRRGTVGLSVIQKMTLSAKKNIKNMFTGIIEATGEVKK